MAAKVREISLLHTKNYPIPFLKKWKEELDMKLTTLTDSEIMMTLTASTLQDLCLWILLNTAIDIALSEDN